MPLKGLGLYVVYMEACSVTMFVACISSTRKVDDSGSGIDGSSDGEMVAVHEDTSMHPMGVSAAAPRPNIMTPLTESQTRLFCFWRNYSIKEYESKMILAESDQLSSEFAHW